MNCETQCQTCIPHLIQTFKTNQQNTNQLTDYIHLPQIQQLSQGYQNKPALRSLQLKNIRFEFDPFRLSQNVLLNYNDWNIKAWIGPTKIFIIADEGNPNAYIDGKLRVCLGVLDLCLINSTPKPQFIAVVDEPKKQSWQLPFKAVFELCAGFPILLKQSTQQVKITFCYLKNQELTPISIGDPWLVLVLDQTETPVQIPFQYPGLYGYQPVQQTVDEIILQMTNDLIEEE